MAVEIRHNDAIDILKLVCSIMVIFLHVPGPLYHWYLPILRCAVPIFLIISGYLLFDANSTKFGNRIKRNVRKILWLCIWATLFYIPILIVKNHGLGFIGLRTLFNWAFFNVTPFGFHLWYLFAYLYTLIIIYFVSKHNFLHIIYFSIPVLLATDLVLGKYSIVVLGREFPHIYVRNFLCVGIPYFAIGMLIKKYENKFLEYDKIYYWGGAVVFALMSIGEYYILETNDLNAHRDHYLSTTFLSICIFLIAIKSPNSAIPNLALWGREYSLYIYIFHVVFLMALPFVNRWIFSEIIAEKLNHMFAPIFVTVETLIFVVLLKRSQGFFSKSCSCQSK